MLTSSFYNVAYVRGRMQQTYTQEETIGRGPLRGQPSLLMRHQHILALGPGDECLEALGRWRGSGGREPGGVNGCK